MPLIDLADDTFVAAQPARVARVVHDPASWLRWWPDLLLESTRDRGDKGHQWVARTRTAPDDPRALVGTVELWLEPWGDGVVVHHYLRLDRPSPGGPAPRWAERERRRRALAWKRHAHALKDRLEVGRTTGLAVQEDHPSGRSSS